MSYTQIHTEIIRWYAEYGRQELPWRNTSDAYAIYVSEVMLQQTQVQTVLERFYYPFLEQFPTFEALARADEVQVLKAWEGLGYYSRARNLHKAAIQADGIVPSTFDGLIALPGIGKNTAHAILAFAYHQPYPVLEANVKRVLTRFFAHSEPSDAQLWHWAQQLLDETRPFEYNQAMMDIGATICVKKPHCAQCPLQSECLGQQDPLAYRVKRPKLAKKIRRETVMVCYDPRKGVRLKMRQSQLLNGLYGFIAVDLADVEAVEVQLLGQVTHVYSHFKLIADVYFTRQFLPQWEGEWVALEKIDTIPLSKLDHKIQALISHKLEL